MHERVQNECVILTPGFCNWKTKYFHFIYTRTQSTVPNCSYFNTKYRRNYCRATRMNLNNVVSVAGAWLIYGCLWEGGGFCRVITIWKPRFSPRTSILLHFRAGYKKRVTGDKGPERLLVVYPFFGSVDLQMHSVRNDRYGWQRDVWEDFPVRARNARGWDNVFYCTGGLVTRAKLVNLKFV